MMKVLDLDKLCITPGHIAVAAHFSGMLSAEAIKHAEKRGKLGAA